MGDASIDPRLAAAESQLDRLDDDPAEAAPEDHGASVIEHEDSMHVENDGKVVEIDEPDTVMAEHGLDIELADCVYAFNEAFNARDLDSLLELVTDDCEAPGLGNDLDSFPEAVEHLWERRPSCCLTRSEHDGRSLSVMWELGDGPQWWPIAVVHFDDVRESQLGVIEFSDDPGLLEEVASEQPDLDLDEGARWEEWDEGAPDDG